MHYQGNVTPAFCHRSWYIACSPLPSKHRASSGALLQSVSPSQTPSASPFLLATRTSIHALARGHSFFFRLADAQHEPQTKCQHDAPQHPPNAPQHRCRDKDAPTTTSLVRSRPSPLPAPRRAAPRRAAPHHPSYGRQGARQMPSSIAQTEAAAQRSDARSHARVPEIWPARASDAGRDVDDAGSRRRRALPGLAWLGWRGVQPPRVTAERMSPRASWPPTFPTSSARPPPPPPAGSTQASSRRRRTGSLFLPHLQLHSYPSSCVHALP